MCLCIFFFFIISCQVQPTLNTEQRNCVKFGCTTSTMRSGLCWPAVLLSVPDKPLCDAPHETQKRFKLAATSWQFSPAPLACTTLSGILSRSKWAISSVKTTSWTSSGPLGPAVCRFSLSPTGWPAPVVSVSAFCWGHSSWSYYTSYTSIPKYIILRDGCINVTT